MTEAEWPAWEYPTPMLGFLRGKASDRKLRLFGVACCRRIRPLLTDNSMQAAVEGAEQYADGRVGQDEFENAAAEVEAIGNGLRHQCFAELNNSGRCHAVVGETGQLINPVQATEFVAYRKPEPELVASSAAQGVSPDTQTEDRSAQYELVRCVFGNPYRPVSTDRSWLSTTVLSLARQMYESRDFSPMPILADALQDAGCDDDDVLSHCRGPGPHVRGCWVVDLVLGKT
ncbi:MAG: hypothetical protein JWO38_1110 [Gemmataceae bacterium]|nr:hypothetical protein [Gemmataceae bacterium]